LGIFRSILGCLRGMGITPLWIPIYDKVRHIDEQINIEEPHGQSSQRPEKLVQFVCKNGFPGPQQRAVHGVFIAGELLFLPTTCATRR
jgi:hypothetical protein